MKKKYQITPEHRIELEKIKQKYIDNAYRTDAMTDHDRDQMRIAMRGLYKNANLPYPGDDKIIFVSSPLIAQFAAGFAMSLKHGQNARLAADQADQAARQAEQAARLAAEQAAEQADQAAHQAARLAAEQAADQARLAAEQAADQADQAARLAARLAAEQADQAARLAAHQAAEQAGQAAEQAAEHNGTSLELFLSAFISVGHKFGKFGLFSASFAWRYRARSALWPWYQIRGDFFKNVAKIESDWEKWDPLNLDALHGGVRFMTPDWTIIADRPEVLKIDDGVLHCENGPAIKWRDGMEMYYWRGVLIPDYWITNRAKLTPEIALKWENIEQARCAQEILGLDKILNHPSVNAKLIDAHDDPQIGELYNVTLREEVGEEALLKVECGTGRIFVMRVDKQYTTALEANASLGGWRKGMKTPPINFIPMIRS